MTFKISSGSFFCFVVVQIFLVSPVFGDLYCCDGQFRPSCNIYGGVCYYNGMAFGTAIAIITSSVIFFVIMVVLFCYLCACCCFMGRRRNNNRGQIYATSGGPIVVSTVHPAYQQHLGIVNANYQPYPGQNQVYHHLPPKATFIA